METENGHIGNIQKMLRQSSEFGNWSRPSFLYIEQAQPLSGNKHNDCSGS